MNLKKTTIISVCFFMNTSWSAPIADVITNPQASADNTVFNFSYSVTSLQKYYRVYLDLEHRASSGFPQGGLYANYLIENDVLYKYVGPGWNWSKVKSLGSTTGTNNSWVVPRADVLANANLAGTVDYLYQVESPLGISSYTKLTLTYPGADGQNSDLPPPIACAKCTSQIAQGAKWNYVISETPKFSVLADIYDISGFSSDAKLVNKIHTQGSKAICYVSAGSWEDWRPDANQFPESVKGSSNGWPGEKWLDIRQTKILLPIMQARINMCKEKGFDAIEFDNVDGYTNKTGFPLKSAEQAYYNASLANMAHQAGLAVGLKNDLNQVEQLLPYFDFAINEQCFEYNECDDLMPFINANKAVLNVEYNLATSKFCSKANAMRFSAIKKDGSLKEKVTFCN
ncbi:Uncharacterized conserved protein [Legionella beliardensis]|uniref:Uncharacterized conserved protein n=1 Tax=Legionella beliardensis TaxID=91822 RepID=A0A378JYE9_9GAMM|nr:endo alpha-1,4 polygalactosaminidase [Legionella beliardensis]STX55772.1 Uncharacterized conserved protein [Legionella beliardensis]